MIVAASENGQRLYESMKSDIHTQIFLMLPWSSSSLVCSLAQLWLAADKVGGIVDASGAGVSRHLRIRTERTSAE